MGISNINLTNRRYKESLLEKINKLPDSDNKIFIRKILKHVKVFGTYRMEVTRYQRGDSKNFVDRGVYNFKGEFTQIIKAIERNDDIRVDECINLLFKRLKDKKILDDYGIRSIKISIAID